MVKSLKGNCFSVVKSLLYIFYNLLPPATQMLVELVGIKVHFLDPITPFYIAVVYLDMQSTIRWVSWSKWF